MVYTINKGLESEQWRKYVAGFAALVISAVMPVLSMLVFNTSDNPGQDVKGVSNVNKPTNDGKRPSDKSNKDTDTAHNNPTNQPDGTSSAAQTGSAVGDAAAAAATPYNTLATGAAVSSNSGDPYAAPGAATSGGGRGGGAATPAPAPSPTAPASTDTAQPSDCGCSDGTETTAPISVDLLNTVEVQLDPTNPTNNSLNLGL